MKKSKAGSAVFVVSLVLIAIMAIWSVALNESFTKVSNAAFTFLTTDFGWLYLLAMMIFLVFVIYMAFGKYGKIRLGGDDSKPEYSNLTWFGLLFGCGMGVGLVFWGVAEPLTHYLNPVGVESATGSGRLRNEILFYALGDPSMGKLCGDWTRTGILYVQKK